MKDNSRRPLLHLLFRPKLKVLFLSDHTLIRFVGATCCCSLIGSLVSVIRLTSEFVQEVVKLMMIAPRVNDYSFLYSLTVSVKLPITFKASTQGLGFLRCLPGCECSLKMRNFTKPQSQYGTRSVAKTANGEFTPSSRFTEDWKQIVVEIYIRLPGLRFNALSRMCLFREEPLVTFIVFIHFITCATAL